MGVTVIRRISWPDADYLQVLPDGVMNYWDNAEFTWHEGFVVPLNDVIASDWIVVS